MAQILKKGIKYVKINKVDALGNDKTSLLRQLQNIRLVYGDLGVKQYNVYGVTEYPTYFQYQVNYTNVTSSTDTGVLDYVTQTTSSTGTWAGPWISDDMGTVITTMTTTPTPNSRFNTSSGTYKLQSTTLEHYPNTEIQITASVAYIPNPAGNPIYPQLWLTLEGGLSPLIAVTASGVTTAGTLTLTASLNSATLAPLTQVSRGGIQFQVYNDTNLNPAEFSDFRLRINQADNSSSYVQRLVVPSPDTAVKFTGTDCDVTYGSIDRYDLSQYFMDVDYTTGIAVPTNQTALISGSATKAPVKDYYYNLKAQTTPRYEGVRVTQYELNKYTGATPELYINGTNYRGDTGYGKTPNVELLQSYFAWFNRVNGATPEINDAVNINIKYLIDGLGNTYSPELTRFFLPELRSNFQQGGLSLLNFVDDVSGTNTTPNAIKTALNGSRRIIRSGVRAGAVLYTQTGSAPSAYTQSLQFTTIENGSTYKILTDYRFGAQTATGDVSYSTGVHKIDFTKINWDFDGGFSLVGDTYTYGSTPLSKISHIVEGGQWLASSGGGNTEAELQIRVGATVIATQPFRTGDIIYGVQSNYQQFNNGDQIAVYLVVTKGAVVKSGQVDWLSDQQQLTQQNFPVVTAPFFYTSSTNPYILTASLKFSSSLDQGFQVNLSGSGFDPVRSKASFIAGDQLRFENNELNTYTINKILANSRETSNGETYLLLDKPLTYGTNVDYFLLRRFYADSSNVILEAIKPAGDTGPGSLSPQYITQQLQDNMATIVAKLSRENSI